MWSKKGEGDVREEASPEAQHVDEKTKERVDKRKREADGEREMFRIDFIVKTCETFSIIQCKKNEHRKI